MRIAVVAGVVVPSDAISAAVESQARLLATLPGVQSVEVFAQHVSRPLSCPHHIVRNSWELLRHPAFVACDVAIAHWGIHYDSFDALTLLAAGTVPGPRPVVHFHNCTPLSLASPDQRDLIRRSFTQIEHVISLDVPLWTYSEHNRRTLLALGARPAPAGQISFVPFPIDVPVVLRGRPGDGRVHLLTVGRMVPAKGVQVLVDAIGRLHPATRALVSVRVAGAAMFSDVQHVAELRATIERLHLGDTVELVLDPTDDELMAMYASSDVVVSPSFHEGLCIPVIEGYASGCRAIGTTAGNLPFLVVDGDPCVPPGDVVALAAAITAVVDEVLAGVDEHRDARAAVAADYTSAATRRHLADALLGT